MDEIGKGDVYKAERILDTKNVKVTLTIHVFMKFF